MIKTISKYPQPLSLQYGTDVRVFDEKLFSLLDDLKDTINENNLTALSAFQIGSYFNVIVYKDENGAFVEMVNPVQISHNCEVLAEETTSYYEGLHAEIKRFEDISIVYQNKTAEDQALKCSGKLARTLQRKMDYLFGSTFIDRMSKDERKKFENKLSGSTSNLKQNYFTKKTTVVLVLISALSIYLLFI